MTDLHLSLLRKTVETAQSADVSVSKAALNCLLTERDALAAEVVELRKALETVLCVNEESEYMTGRERHSMAIKALRIEAPSGQEEGDAQGN